MMQVVAIKEGKFFHGNAVEVASVIGRNPETVRRWWRSGKNMHVNGWDVYVRKAT